MMKHRKIGTITYLDGMRGAVADIRNGCCELLAGVVEAKDAAALTKLSNIADALTLELQSVKSAAADKLRKFNGVR